MMERPVSSNRSPENSEFSLGNRLQRPGQITRKVFRKLKRLYFMWWRRNWRRALKPRLRKFGWEKKNWCKWSNMNVSLIPLTEFRKKFLCENYPFGDLRRLLRPIEVLKWYDVQPFARWKEFPTRCADFVPDGQHLSRLRSSHSTLISFRNPPVISRRDRFLNMCRAARAPSRQELGNCYCKQVCLKSSRVSNVEWRSTSIDSWKDFVVKTTGYDRRIEREEKKQMILI